MQYHTLSEISLLIACPVCKTKGLKSWYYDSNYLFKKKTFIFTVHFECCVCDSLVEVKDYKLKMEVYNKMRHFDYGDDDDDDEDEGCNLHSF